MLPPTKPLPDEPVCSALVRCSRNSRLPFKTLAREVLGLPGLRANFFSIWPLKPLEELLGTPAQTLLWRHTSFGYATAFVGNATYVLAHQVAITGAPRIALLSAVMQNVSAEVPLRRLCPECVSAEMKGRGESYWHRSHNLPGVLRCAIHGCELRQTSVAASGTLKTLYTLPHECKRTRSLKSPTSPAQQLLERRSLELLNREPGPGEFTDAAGYRGLASNFGWLSSAREVNEAAVSACLKQAYPRKFLQLCGLGSGEWAAHAFRPNVPFSAGTLRHLLLQCALEQHADQPGALDHIPTGPPGTASAAADVFYAKAARRELRSALRSGDVLTTRSFLQRSGAYGAYRHRRDELPLLREVVLEFRSSGASIKPLASGKRLFRSLLDELVP